MAQNIYDDQAFFDEYARERRSVEGLDGAPEWPALRAMLGDVKLKKVLDLGCGYGWFCRWVAQAGAVSVHGIDVSGKMLERAKSMTTALPISYQQADLDQVQLEASSYDVAYSSLVFHYLADLDRLFGEVHKALRPGGVFIFSVEHPISTAPSHPDWETSESGEPIWPLNSYSKEGKRNYSWLGSDTVEKYHRTIETYLRTLWRAGFSVVDLEEWKPSDDDIIKFGWVKARERPIFLLIAAKKN